MIRLYMEARMEQSVMSRNVVAEIRGSTYPDEVRNTPSLPPLASFGLKNNKFIYRVFSGGSHQWPY